MKDIPTSVYLVIYNNSDNNAFPVHGAVHGFQR